jgi:hypothetical protein
MAKNPRKSVKQLTAYKIRDARTRPGSREWTDTTATKKDQRHPRKYPVGVKLAFTSDRVVHPSTHVIRP